MKKLFLFFVFIGSLALLNSCSDDSDVKRTETISEKVRINTSNPLGRIMELEAEFTAEIDSETQLVISYDVSENLLAYVNMGRTEFDLFLQEHMGDEYYTIFNGENGGDSQTPH